MKIIGGVFKGRRIDMPKGIKIRPTSDKVREALFNIIMERLKDASVLDLFAGSGSLGLEALSRGARSATFVDREKRCIDTIRRNVATLAIDANKDITILLYDSTKSVKKLSDSKIRFDLVFLDPPYYGHWIKKCLISLDKYDILNNSALVICEHFKKDAPPDRIGRLKRGRQSRYGDTVLSFYVKERE